MDIVPPSDLPGAAFDFRDVRNVFEDAAAGQFYNISSINIALSINLDMDGEQMLFMEGFVLQDAMAAFEVTKLLP